MSGEYDYGITGKEWIYAVVSAVVGGVGGYAVGKALDRFEPQQRFKPLMNFATAFSGFIVMETVLNNISPPTPPKESLASQTHVPDRLHQ